MKRRKKILMYGHHRQNVLFLLLTTCFCFQLIMTCLAIQTTHESSKTKATSTSPKHDSSKTKANSTSPKKTVAQIVVDELHRSDLVHVAGKIRKYLRNNELHVDIGFYRFGPSAINVLRRHLARNNRKNLMAMDIYTDAVNDFGDSIRSLLHMGSILMDGLDNSKCVRGQIYFPSMAIPEGYGLVIVHPGSGQPFLCDMVTEGGGWTIFQRRVSTETDFNRNWAAYKKGFGSLKTNFWMGNDKLSNLTRDGSQEMRIDLITEHDGQSIYFKYTEFRVDDEEHLYRLTVSGFSGTNTYDAMKTHNGMSYSTYDRDNDNDTVHCAKKYGAWWDNNCYDSNLNGIPGNSEPDELGAVWRFEDEGRNINCSFTQMMIRRKN